MIPIIRGGYKNCKIAKNTRYQACELALRGSSYSYPRKPGMKVEL